MSKTDSAFRSRTALTRCALRPVLDGGGKDSIFASIFTDTLAQHQDVREGLRRHGEIPARVAGIALRQIFERRPECGAIRFAGGGAGEYLFVPKT